MSGVWKDQLRQTSSSWESPNDGDSLSCNNHGNPILEIVMENPILSLSNYTPTIWNFRGGVRQVKACHLRVMRVHRDSLHDTTILQSGWIQSKGLSHYPVGSALIGGVRSTITILDQIRLWKMLKLFRFEMDLLKMQKIEWFSELNA